LQSRRSGSLDDVDRPTLEAKLRPWSHVGCPIWRLAEGFARVVIGSRPADVLYVAWVRFCVPRAPRLSVFSPQLSELVLRAAKDRSGVESSPWPPPRQRPRIARSGLTSGFGSKMAPRARNHPTHSFLSSSVSSRIAASMPRLVGFWQIAPVRQPFDCDFLKQDDDGTHVVLSGAF
jgi:hypothetical protein